MYKLLIVDDEIWVRERLKCTIDWNELGIMVIGEATDGEEALTLTEKLTPDIVVTDIRMPCIDGIEYIKRLREKKNETKVIIISGYSDFEYAQRAIKLGAFDYILKPIEDEELINVIKRCLEEIKLHNNQISLFKRAQQQLEENISVLKEKFFINLINGYFQFEEDVFRDLVYSKLGLEGCRNLCIIIELDESKYINHDKNILQTDIINIVNESLSTFEGSQGFFLNTGELICLVFSDKDEETLTKQMIFISENIKKMAKLIIGRSVTIGIGRAYRSMYNLSLSYKEAKEALQYKAFIGKDRIFHIENIHNQYKLNYHKFKDIDILLNNIKMGSKEKALLALSNIIEKTKVDGEIYPIDLKFLYIDIVNSVFKTILNVKASAEDFSSFSFKFFKQMNSLETIDETYEWLADTILKIIDTIECYKNLKKRKIIEKALEYIHAHYTEQITLNIVADRLFMNASYFCKIFREEMGEPFTKYFINLRIQKAKEYMIDPTLKIYEIAEKVGYTDIQYFTKIFKSIQGVTPVQYREKIK